MLHPCCSYAECCALACDRSHTHMIMIHATIRSHAGHIPKQHELSCHAYRHSNVCFCSQQLISERNPSRHVLLKLMSLHQRSLCWPVTLCTPPICGSPGWFPIWPVPICSSLWSLVQFSLWSYVLVRLRATAALPIRCLKAVACWSLFTHLVIRLVPRLVFRLVPNS